MNAPAQPDDAPPETPATPLRRPYVAMAMTVLLTLFMTAFYCAFAWRLLDYDRTWDSGLTIAGCNNAVSIAIVGAFMLAALGGGTWVLFRAWRGRPVTSIFVPICMILFFLSFIAFSGLTRYSRISANEGNAIAAMKILASAQYLFHKDTGTYAYPLSDLPNPLVPSNPAASFALAAAINQPGKKAFQGFYFMPGKVRSSSPDECDFFATPARYGISGVNTLYIDQRGIIRMNSWLGRSITPEEAQTMDTSDASGWENL